MSRRLSSWILLIGALASLGPACSRDPAERTRKYRERAASYLQERKYREASIEYQAALQKWPDDPDSLYGLAQALNEQGQYAEYRATLAKVLKAKPDHVKACVELGGLFWASGQYVQAAGLAARAVRAAPNSLDALRVQARTFASLGKTGDARDSWGKALSTPGADDGTHVEAASFETAVGDPVRAGQVLAEGLKRFPRSPRLLLAQADLLSLQGDWAGAERAIARAQTASPNDPNVYAGQARYRLRRGEPERALRELQGAEAQLAGVPHKAAEVALARSRLLLELGDVAQAELALRSARRVAPKDPEVVAALIQTLVFQGKADEARSLLPDARAVDAAGRAASLLEAQVYLLDGRPNWAEQLLRGLVGRGDTSVETRFLYAKSLAQQQKWAPARKQYETVLARVPGHFFARLDMAELLRVQREFVGAMGQLDRLGPGVGRHPRVRLLRTRILLEKGDIEAARRLTSTMLHEAPGSAVLLVLAGDIARAQGNSSDAVALYRKAQAAAPRAPEPLLAEVDVVAALGGPQKARRLLEDFQGRTKETPETLNRIATLALAEGDAASALSRVNRSLQLEPNHWESRFVRARILLAQGQEAKARGDLQEAIRLHPLRPEPCNLLADLMKKKGDLRGAEEVYRRLLEVNPGEPLTANNLASLYLEQGRAADALPLAEEALAGAPESPAVWDTLGWAYHLSGNRDKGARYLDRARRAYPRAPEVLLHWALNQQELGKRIAAREALEQVGRLAPGTPLAARAAQALAGTPAK